MQLWVWLYQNYYWLEDLDQSKNIHMVEVHMVEVHVRRLLQLAPPRPFGQERPLCKLFAVLPLRIAVSGAQYATSRKWHFGSNGTVMHH